VLKPVMIFNSMVRFLVSNPRICPDPNCAHHNYKDNKRCFKCGTCPDEKIDVFSQVVPSSKRVKISQDNTESNCDGKRKKKKKKKKAPKKKRKKKKRKSRRSSSIYTSSSDSDSEANGSKALSIEELRQQRLKREREERLKAARLCK